MNLTFLRSSLNDLRQFDYFFESKIYSRVIGITQPPPRDGAWSALFSNMSKPGLDNYVVKRPKCPLLEEVA